MTGATLEREAGSNRKTRDNRPLSWGRSSYHRDPCRTGPDSADLVIRMSYVMNSEAGVIV
jgi:hypothetical protein